MRCLIHDFAGHPFQIQLSRELACFGHEVAHLYPGGLPGPKGRLATCDSDSDRFRVQSIPLSRSFRKYSPHRRFVTQRKYASELKRTIQSFRPDVVLSGNTPIDVQAELLWHCRLNKIGFVHWVQDVYCQALEFVLRKKIRALSRPLSAPFKILEQRVAAHSSANIVIAPSFKTLLRGWGVPDSRITVLENWAPLEEVKMLPPKNAWSFQQNIGDKPVFLYSGTLGLKHRPDLLYQLAKELGESATIIVVSEGTGRTWLEQQPILGNLRLLDFQPYERLSEVLASADVLLATLESDAGQFAVPSKILSYLCAGRPLLLAGPKENLAAVVIERSGSGISVSADDTPAWITAAKSLLAQPALRAAFGNKARMYAEHAFDIRSIARTFETVLLSVSAN